MCCTRVILGILKAIMWSNRVDSQTFLAFRVLLCTALAIALTVFDQMIELLQISFAHLSVEHFIWTTLSYFELRVS